MITSVKTDEWYLLNDPEYREKWVENEIKSSTRYFLSEIGVEDSCLCDCDKAWNFGKRSIKG